MLPRSEFFHDFQCLKDVFFLLSVLRIRSSSFFVFTLSYHHTTLTPFIFPHSASLSLMLSLSPFSQTFLSPPLVWLSASLLAPFMFIYPPFFIFFPVVFPLFRVAPLSLARCQTGVMVRLTLPVARCVWWSPFAVVTCNCPTVTPHEKPRFSYLDHPFVYRSPLLSVHSRLRELPLVVNQRFETESLSRPDGLISRSLYFDTYYKFAVMFPRESIYGLMLLLPDSKFEHARMTN